MLFGAPVRDVRLMRKSSGVYSVPGLLCTPRSSLDTLFSSILFTV